MSANYRNQEYADLLLAQKALAEALKPRSSGEPIEVKTLASATLALVKVIELKREIRGIGAPKPVDYSTRRRKPQPLDDEGSIDA